MIKSAKKEFIFRKNEKAPSCHASTVLPLDDGTVLEIKDMYAFCEYVENRW